MPPWALMSRRLPSQRASSAEADIVFMDFNIIDVFN
jgi:hypothetical protein